MSDVVSMQGDIFGYEKKITVLEKRIVECEDAYDSLWLFKSSVASACGNFNAENSDMEGKLANIQPIIDRCICAEEYSKGMNRTLNGVGTKVVGVAFSGLEGMINIRLGAYKAEILACESEIRRLRGVISALKEAIKVAQAAISES